MTLDGIGFWWEKLFFEYSTLLHIIMDAYFGEDTPLPSARPITRESFSSDLTNFNVDEFLTHYHKYQTLDDLRQQLQQWSNTLNQELIDMINQDYGDFLNLGKSLNGGESKVDDIKMQVLSFERETGNVQQELENSIQNVDRLMNKKKQLTALQVSPNL